MAHRSLSTTALLAGRFLAGAAVAQTAASGPVQQLRIYEIVEQNRTAFHDRFRDHATRIMARHGFEILGMWESATSGKTEFVYLITWANEIRMRTAWEGFLADPEWADIERQSAAKHGRFVVGIQDRVLQATPYQPYRSDPRLAPGSSWQPPQPRRGLDRRLRKRAAVKVRFRRAP